MRRIVAALLLTGALSLGGAATAMAAANPNGTGPPNQSCQAFEGPGDTNAPGHSGTSPGSVFNEPGFGSPHRRHWRKRLQQCGCAVPVRRRLLPGQPATSIVTIIHGRSVGLSGGLLPMAHGASGTVNELILGVSTRR